MDNRYHRTMVSEKKKQMKLALQLTCFKAWSKFPGIERENPTDLGSLTELRRKWLEFRDTHLARIFRAEYEEGNCTKGAPKICRGSSEKALAGCCFMSAWEENTQGQRKSYWKAIDWRIPRAHTRWRIYYVSTIRGKRPHNT